MGNVILISDTHFGHSNILKFKVEGNPARPFSSTKEMDEFMIDAWNSRVAKDDLVYHLGDFAFASKGYILNIASKLNGRKRLIVGNHDDIKFLAKADIFQKIYYWKRFNEHKIIATHVPLHVGSIPSGYINVHGHLHTREVGDPLYKSVCVELIDYAPIKIEDLKCLCTSTAAKTAAV